MKTDWRWVDFHVLWRAAGLRNVRGRLDDLIAQRDVRQIGRGLYRVNRRRVRERMRRRRR